MRALYKTMLVIVIIGAINWGMIGLFDVNLIALLFGEDTFATNLVYSLVGIAGLISCALLFDPFEHKEK